MALEKLDTVETILGVRAKDEDDRWFLNGEMSEMWVYTMSEHWASRVYSEYYTDFWQDLLDSLNDERNPVEITLELEYEFGMTTEDDVQGYLANHSTGPRFLVMHREADDKAQMACVWMKSYKVKELESV